MRASGRGLGHDGNTDLAARARTARSGRSAGCAANRGLAPQASNGNHRHRERRSRSRSRRGVLHPEFHQRPSVCRRRHTRQPRSKQQSLLRGPPGTTVHGSLPASRSLQRLRPVEPTARRGKPGRRSLGRSKPSSACNPTCLISSRSRSLPAKSLSMPRKERPPRQRHSKWSAIRSMVDSKRYCRRCCWQIPTASRSRPASPL